MTASDGIEPAVEWLRRQGHRVVVTPHSCWFDAAPGVFQAFPYHPVIDPADDELRRVFRAGRAAALRYSAPVSSPIGKISYHVVYSGPAYGLDQVSRQTRQNIRKGLDHATYGPISLARLADEGWTLRAETLARQGRPKAESGAWWRKMCLSAEGLPGFEAWGGQRDGRLVAALFSYAGRDSYLMLYQQSATEHLKYGINNALGFTLTQHVCARPSVKEIFYGFQSLDADSEVDEFKFRMGYGAVPVRQRVQFHPVVRPFVKRSTLTAVGYLLRGRLAGSKWPKAAGMMRFFLEGNRPLCRQEFPKCLDERRAELLEKLV